MSDLYPTKTRLALLADIRDDRISTDVSANHDRIILFPNAPTEYQTQQVVTARVRELEAAGWIEEDLRAWQWQLTDAGRAVLDGAS